MRILVALLALVQTGCSWLFAETNETVVWEQTILPTRQPGDDPVQPQMQILRTLDDGTTIKSNGNADYAWGIRYRVKMTEVKNLRWSTSTLHADILGQEDVTSTHGIFTVEGLSAPYFGPDRRAFIDGKAFVCPADLAAALDRAIASGAPFTLQMAFGETAAQPLTVTAVQQAPSAP